MPGGRQVCYQRRELNFLNIRKARQVRARRYEHLCKACHGHNVVPRYNGEAYVSGSLLGEGGEPLYSPYVHDPSSHFISGSTLLSLRYSREVRRGPKDRVPERQFSYLLITFQVWGTNPYVTHI